MKKLMTWIISVLKRADVFYEMCKGIAILNKDVLLYLNKVYENESKITKNSPVKENGQKYVKLKKRK